MNNWKPVETAPQERPVWYRNFNEIDPEKCSDEHILIRRGGLHFVPDLSMYVYYSVNQWRELDDEGKKSLGEFYDSRLKSLSKEIESLESLKRKYL